MGVALPLDRGQLFGNEIASVVGGQQDVDSRQIGHGIIQCNIYKVISVRARIFCQLSGARP